MEDSFQLLSSMSPKVRGRQKTIQVKKASRLALKKHFRRSSVFDKSFPINNEDLAIVEVNTESTESIGSKELIRAKDTNDIVIIESSCSEDEENPSKKVTPSCLPNSNDNKSKHIRIRQWLDEIDEDRRCETFFSQVSTIVGDDAPNVDIVSNNIAACSSFNDCITHRFDELFINKKNGMKSIPKENNNEDNLSDDSFSLGISISLTSKLKGLSNSRNSNNSSKKSLEKCTDLKNDLVIDETLLTDDESLKPPLQKSPLKTPPKSIPTIGEFVSTRKKKDLRNEVECAKTPIGQNVQEAASMLDSLYGNSWRKKEQRVLLPLSEPKKKQIGAKKIIAPNTERIMKPTIKDAMLTKPNPATNRLNFKRLNTPVHSSWVNKLQGLVDSDSDSDGGDRFEKSKGLELAKTRLDFGDNNSSLETNKSNTNKKVSKTNNNKENIPGNANKKPLKKPGNCETGTNNKNNKAKNVQTKTSSKTNTKPISRSSTSTNSWSEGEDDFSTDDEYDKEIQILEIRRKSIMPTKLKTYSFLESLSVSVPINKCDTSARIFRSSFKLYKEELVKKLFTLFNEKVFDNALPKDTELEWNDKLTKTAGLCYCKKITHRSGNLERKVRIALSTKVLDSPDRLRDTLIHEMCHAVTWIVNQVSDGHGAYWKSWAFKAMKIFPELPAIKRCHTYSINTKYTYKCTGCGYSFGRHSKSLDTERKRCGHCYGKFEVLLNKTTKNGDTKTVPVTPRKEATGFALFVKENYARYKNPSKKHGDVMKVLGQKFAEMKVKNGS